MKKAEDALTLAKAAITMEDGDGAANRAYYSMFHAARATLILKTDLDPSKIAKTHSGLISAFNLHFIQEGSLPVEMGKSLSRAHETRLMADYKGTFVSIESAQHMIDSAESFLDALKDLSLDRRQDSDEDADNDCTP